MTSLLPTLPRSDFPVGDTRAWLYDGERRWLDALDCPDLSVSTTVEVLLVEHRGENGGRKRGRKYAVRGPRTPEQSAREDRASDLIDVRMAVAGAAPVLLAAVAKLRRRLHAATVAPS